MGQVETIKGLVDRDKLDVKDIVTEDENARCIRTEWYLDGELVKADAHVIILRTPAIGGEQAAV